MDINCAEMDKDYSIRFKILQEIILACFLLIKIVKRGKTTDNSSQGVSRCSKII
jgi:hypothetical protein